MLRVMPLHIFNDNVIIYVIFFNLTLMFRAITFLQRSCKQAKAFVNVSVSANAGFRCDTCRKLWRMLALRLF